MERKGIVSFIKTVWIYTVYQLITKLLLSLLIFPTSSRIMQILLKARGRVNISSGDFLGFVFSMQGMAMILLGIMLLTLLVGMDINALIIISVLNRKGSLHINIGRFILTVLKSLKNFLNPPGLLLMLYIAIVIPIVGIGFTVTPMKGFEIPNFIKDVIFGNRLYSVLYILLMIILSIISIIHVFVFHYIVLLNQQILTGLKNARNFMKKHWRAFFIDFVLVFLLWIIIIVAVIFCIAVIVVNSEKFLKDIVLSRAVTVGGMLMISEISAYMIFLTAPLIADRLTILFYRYNLKDGNPVKSNVGEESLKEEKPEKAGFRTLVMMGAFLTVFVFGNVLIGAVSIINFDEFFKADHYIDIVAHRGGGDLAAENSVAGLKEAIKAGASWSEIDVQRTKDGNYIINHDNTFKRVTGVSKKSTDLTLEEIKQLEIKDLFDRKRPPQKVATIEEFLDEARGRIGLFIELKGSTADTKMADDIIAMVKERNMLKEVAIISLDYSLIKYIEDKYPEVDTGFVYFFSIGETAKMKGDILIMEEREATAKKIADIQRAGKRAVVWTVNKEESINRFLKSDIDAIITDHVIALEEEIKRREDREDYEIILENFLE